MKKLQAEYSNGVSEEADSRRSGSNDSQSFIGENIVSSFYYSFRGGPSEMRHELMLRSIAYQVFGQNERLFALIRKQFRKKMSEQSPWNYQDLKSVLNSLHNTPFPIRIYVAVDGLDESDNALRDDVLQFFAALVTPQSRCVLKVLLASRPENDIKPWMNRAHHIVLEEMNHKDIRLVIRSGMRTLEETRRSIANQGVAPVESRDHNQVFSAAEKYILVNSRGVFLWATLVLRELESFLRCGGYSLEDIDECVRRLPKELGGPGGFYTAMVEKLVKQTSRLPGHEARGRRIFAWVTFSEGQLSVSELRDALALPSKPLEETNLATFDLARARPIDFERGLSSLCGGFIEVRIRFQSQREL